MADPVVPGVSTLDLAAGVSHDFVAEAREAFSLFDRDNTGTITVGNLTEVMSVVGQAANLDEIERLLQTADVGKDGEIDFPDFLSLMIRTRELGPSRQQRATQPSADPNNISIAAAGPSSLMSLDASSFGLSLFSMQQSRTIPQQIAPHQQRQASVDVAEQSPVMRLFHAQDPDRIGMLPLDEFRKLFTVVIGDSINELASVGGPVSETQEPLQRESTAPAFATSNVVVAPTAPPLSAKELDELDKELRPFVRLTGVGAARRKMVLYPAFLASIGLC